MKLGKGKKILIIDDSEVICKRLCSYLSEIDNVNIVGQAHNLSEGYKLYNILRPNIIILDIRLSSESGISLLKKIREEDSKTTILMFTNYPNLAYRTRCMELGADSFFDKSNDLQHLADLITNFP